MNRLVPPALLQHIVTALLSQRDQETVAGDLLEAYADRRRGRSASSANAWYVRQALSLVPRAAVAAYGRTPGLVFLCCFTAACGAWLGTMDVVLHHHDLLYHEAIAGLIVGQALLTMFTLPLRRVLAFRIAAMFGGAAIMWLGGSALIGVLRGDHTFEGYILVIALMLIIQAALTWRALLRRMPAAA